MPRQLVYVGTYSEGTNRRGQGICVFQHDGATGALTPAGPAHAARNPSWLAFDPARTHLYCVNECDDHEGQASGAVSAFRIDRQTGALAFVNTRASHGVHPCHVVVDASGRHVLVANYTSGSVAVLPILPDGSLGEAGDVRRHAGSSVDPRRQAGPHAHGVTLDPTDTVAFVTDLGLDKVLIYAFDPRGGTLTPATRQPWLATAPGAGPRQIVLHANGRFAFVINELDSTVTSLRYDAAQGALVAVQTLSTLPAGFAGHSTCAQVQIAPSGRFLYGSNRGHDSIAIYAIDQDSGRIALVGHESTRGRNPRHFEISPDGAWLAAANQDSDTVVMFRVDQATGLLTATGTVVEVGTPVCVRFL